MTEVIDVKMTTPEAADFLGITIQHVHKLLKTKGLHYQKSQNRIFFGHEAAKSLFNTPFKRKIITFQIVKGGTGKTSLAHSFAIRASLYGAKVLCIDLDQQGNLTSAFNFNPDKTPVIVDIINEGINVRDAIINIYPGVDLIPSRIENAVLDNIIMLNKHPLDRVYSNILEKIKSDYDLIIIDCPPALGQSVAAATLASDCVIAPLTPEQFSLSGLKITHDELSGLSRKYGKRIDLKIVLNKFDNRTALSSEVLTTLLSHDIYKNMLSKSFIRSCQEFPNTIYTGSTIFSTLKNSSAKEDIDLFTREILELNGIRTTN